MLFNLIIILIIGAVAGLAFNRYARSWLALFARLDGLGALVTGDTIPIVCRRALPPPGTIMRMRMMRHRRAPGVENRGDTDADPGESLRSAAIVSADALDMMS